MAEILALVTAVLVLASAWWTWHTRRQVRDAQTRVQTRVEATQTQVQEVHVMVNSQREAMLAERQVMLARIEELAQALRTSGTAVPPAAPVDEE